MIPSSQPPLLTGQSPPWTEMSSETAVGPPLANGTQGPDEWWDRWEEAAVSGLGLSGPGNQLLGDQVFLPLWGAPELHHVFSKSPLCIPGSQANKLPALQKPWPTGFSSLESVQPAGSHQQRQLALRMNTNEPQTMGWKALMPQQPASPL